MRGLILRRRQEAAGTGRKARPFGSDDFQPALSDSIARIFVARTSCPNQHDQTILGIPAMTFIKKFLNDEHGATAIEYGLIAALISVAAVAGFTAVGSKLSTAMQNVSTHLQ
jgi:pilus assembly protein Flp/PilA